MSTYRKAMPYRKPQVYRGDAIGVSGYGDASTFRLRNDAIASAAGPVSLPLQGIAPRDSQVRVLYDDMAAIADVTALLFQKITPNNTETDFPFNAIAPDSVSKTVPFDYPSQNNQAIDLPYGDHETQSADGTALPYLTRLPENNQTAAMPWGTAAKNNQAISLFWRRMVERGAVFALPWSPLAARQNPTLVHWPVESEPDPSTITVPRLPVYFMIPTISVVRLPERTPINALSVSLSHDIDSWAWTFTAPIPFSEIGLVNPAGASEPTEIEISINGYVWNMMVEGMNDNRKIGSKTATISGKSRSAELAQPYAPKRTYTQTTAKNASQLADDELTGTGWTLVWDAVDWLLPIGGFSYQDLTPIEVISRLAESIGATVQSDMEDKTLYVVPTYEESPWAWDAAIPYAIVPASIITNASGSWQGGTNADGVYVYAQNAAYGALVKITGTAGANQLPMIVDPLLIDADPVRERGRIELARAGKIKMDPITIPLFASPATPGLIPCGKLLEIEEGEDNTWRAQVMGVRIDAQRDGKATSVRQTLTLERQFRE